MAYKNDGHLVIANRYGSASSDELTFLERKVSKRTFNLSPTFLWYKFESLYHGYYDSPKSNNDFGEFVTYKSSSTTIVL